MLPADLRGGPGERLCGRVAVAAGAIPGCSSSADRRSTTDRAALATPTLLSRWPQALPIQHTKLAVERVHGMGFVLCHHRLWRGNGRHEGPKHRVVAYGTELAAPTGLAVSPSDGRGLHEKGGLAVVRVAPCKARKATRVAAMVPRQNSSAPLPGTGIPAAISVAEALRARGLPHRAIHMQGPARGLIGPLRQASDVVATTPVLLHVTPACLPVVEAGIAVVLPPLDR
mmetsp:Transcript_101476/g.282437  ORF Transcript_101476/g.282437 Transcript_101476/m.282437 type:complete len:228 (+) Transcript_101476:448-1131(+)